MLEHLRPLALFAKVVELGSFRAAGRAWGLSPSVVSHHVTELEQRVSAPLLYRSTRRLALTPDGELLLGAAREMLEAAQRGVDAVTGRSAAASGQLRLTAPAFLADTAFPRDLAAFMRAYPRVQLEVSFSEAPRDLLRDALDLAVRIGALRDSSYKVKRLATMHRLIVAAARYLGDRKLPKRPSDLSGWSFVRLSSRPAELTLAAAGRSHTVKLDSRISVDSAAAMRALVLDGGGVAALPEVQVRNDVARGRLVELLPDFRPVPLGVYAVRPGGVTASTLTQTFVDFIAPRTAVLFEPP